MSSAIQDTDRKCNHPTKTGGRCNLSAGFGVQGQLGIGFCFHHRGAEIQVGGAIAHTSVSKAGSMKAADGSFAYRMSTDTRLGAIMDAMGAEMTMPQGSTGVVHVDLSYELAAARAMLALFMERHGAREDALIAWHEAYERGEMSSPPPRVLSVVDGHKAVVGIATLAKTMHELQQAVPRDRFMRILASMGDSVNKHVADPAAKAAIRQDFINACAEYVI